MTEPIKFETGLKYAAMSAKIRTGVVEALIPAIPYLLNFNITDYSYIFSYVEDKVLDEAKQAGLGRDYLDAAEALQEWVAEKVEKQRQESESTTEEDMGSKIMSKVTEGLMSGKVDPDESYTMKTPYLLSNYYGNKPDMSVIDLKIVEDIDGFWRGWKDMLPFKINGITITGKWAFPSLAMFFCINTKAFGNMWDKAKGGGMSPSTGPGGLNYPSLPRPPVLSSQDALRGLITLEVTEFIQKVKMTKDGLPDSGWILPYSYADHFIHENLLKDPPSEFVLSQLQGTPEEEQIEQMMYTKKLVYVPTPDFGAGVGSEQRTTKSLGFPAHHSTSNEVWAWEGVDKNKDGKLDEHDATKQLRAINDPSTTDNSTSIPTIQQTQASETPSDKFNGGMNYFRRAGGFILQYFCKIDSDLWERVEAPPENPEKMVSVETQGLKNLLYLFEHRHTNLKGHINPHYWNSAMSGFFKHLKNQMGASTLHFDDVDLEKFRNRMGAKYANVHMGVRLCWVIPSPMPRIEDRSDINTNITGITPLKWYGEKEYGDPDLIHAYGELSGNEKMRTMLRMDKAHAHVYLHKFPKVIKETVSNGVVKGTTIIDERFVPEYFFTFPIVEVLSDTPASLDPEDWTIQESDFSLEVKSENTISKLLNKLKEDTDFKILLEYIFPISSIIPEVATIYGMEFFKAVSEYITHRKQYFGATRAAADALIDTLAEKSKESYDFSGDET